MIFVIAIVIATALYVGLFWQPCICRYGERCPRHASRGNNDE